MRSCVYLCGEVTDDVHHVAPPEGEEALGEERLDGEKKEDNIHESLTSVGAGE